jgi:hypothetical protein
VGFPEARQHSLITFWTQHARHLIRLRRRYETVQLRDAIPEIVFLNSHDGTSAYQLRVGLFRVACTNGLIVSMGVFPAWRVKHRSDVIRDVVCAALRISERFETLAASVERMERTVLDQEQRLEFAAEALALRLPKELHAGIEPSQVLVPRRQEDIRGEVFRCLKTPRAARSVPTSRSSLSVDLRALRCHVHHRCLPPGEGEPRRSLRARA